MNHVFEIPLNRITNGNLVLCQVELKDYLISVCFTLYSYQLTFFSINKTVGKKKLLND